MGLLLQPNKLWRAEQPPRTHALPFAGVSAVCSWEMTRGDAGLGELDLIQGFRRVFGSPRGRGIALGIGDDCAILRVPAGHEVLVTTDFTLEGRHFRRDLHPAASVGHRCLARGLSDLAAMGAEPLAGFLSLALPASLPRMAAGRRWIAGLVRGMQGLAEASGISIAGGDTAEAPGGEILADIVLVGSAPTGTALRRSGATAGDGLYVTGVLGGAAAQLRGMLASGRMARAGVRGPQLFPEPRLAVGRRLRGLASAAIDLSDGLSTDLGHLCEASGVRAEVDWDALPIHPLAMRFGEEARGLALHGGEDYELLFAARAGVRVPRSIGGVPITRIGRVLKAAGCAGP
jgi:thiamine-monophosphate kinase